MPTSTITAEAVTVDVFTLSQKDTADITTGYGSDGRIATAGFLHGTGIHAGEQEPYQFLLLILEEAFFLAGFGAFKIADVAADSGTVGG